MIYARQIAPEYQDAGYFMEAYTEGEQRINVCGNERFADYTSEDFDRVKEIVNSWELAYVLENLSSYGYANAADAIMYYLPPMKERYTDRDIYDLNLLFTDSHGWEFEHHDNNIPYGYLNTKENFLCEVLSIVYGEKWTRNVIRGSAQVDWNFENGLPTLYQVQKTNPNRKIVIWNDEDKNIHIETLFSNTDDIIIAIKRFEKGQKYY